MKPFIAHTETETEFDLDLLVAEEEHKELILYNDDVNTFEFVIESLVKICGHEMLQAEQCSYIIHNNGKCAVKKGSYTTLEPMCTALLDRGLSACIE